MKMVSTNHLDFHVFEVTWLGFFSDQLETETKIDFPAQLLRQFRINHWNSSCSTIETVAAQPVEERKFNLVDICDFEGSSRECVCP